MLSSWWRTTQAKAPKWPSRTFGLSWHPNWSVTIVVVADVDVLRPPPSAPFLFDTFQWRSMTTVAPLRGREAIVLNAERPSTVAWTRAGFVESAPHGCVTREIQMIVFCSGIHVYIICKYTYSNNYCNGYTRVPFTENVLCQGCVHVCRVCVHVCVQLHVQEFHKRLTIHTVISQLCVCA